MKNHKKKKLKEFIFEVSFYVGLFSGVVIAGAFSIMYVMPKSTLAFPILFAGLVMMFQGFILLGLFE